MAVVHKYVFYITEHGIKTYKAKGGGKYDLIKYKGGELYTQSGEQDSQSYLQDFSNWFLKTASIAKDDKIDFCFLSKKPMESIDFHYPHETYSSWDKGEVLDFCKKEVRNTNYKIIVDENTSFISQVSNIYNEADMEKLYLNCIPDFSMETEEKLDAGSEETSILCRYFIDLLNKRRGI